MARRPRSRPPASPPPAPLPDDPLSLDCLRDLERVDRVMTHVITDPATSTEFIRDPSAVLARLGFHPPASRAVHDRVNEIFYAVLTNVELITLITEHYTGDGAFNRTYRAQIESNEKVLKDGFSRGVIENIVSHDMAAADYVFKQPDFMRQVYRLTLHDLNNRRLLQNFYETEEINDYIESMIDSITRRLPIREHRKLEIWESPHYGVGTGFGVGETEVGPVVTTGAIAQVGVAISVAIPVFGMLPDQEMVVQAARGDPQAVRSLATAGALVHFAGDMLTYAHNFRRR